MEKDHEAARKAEDCKALADAKEQGKEAIAAVKAQIAQDRVASAEARKVEKLRVAAERQAEKARVAAEKKGNRPNKGCVLIITDLTSVDFLLTLEAAKWKATLQMVKGLPEGAHWALSAPQDQQWKNIDEDLFNARSSNDRFSMHSDDSHNFLKLCFTLHILVQKCLLDSDIDLTNHLICEYCIELILVLLLHPAIFTDILIF
jgi:hypothetical protein